MFSTAMVTDSRSESSRTPVTKPAAYSRCQRNGGCTTTVSAPTSWAISALFSSLPQGSVPQTRWVSSRVGAWTAQTGMEWYSER